LGKDFQLSINMSPRQIKVAPEKYKDWTDKLEQYSLSGEQIVIEITEGLLLKSDEIVTERLSYYRNAGVNIAIDDFGTGYSSLAYLKDFNIDYLKIDRSFTCNLQPGSKEHALSETIVVMAHKLGLKVIAEGVETSDQLDMLKTMNCDYGQGYLFSRPLPATEFEKNFIDRLH
jgi:EAL domain-containing protein (putative c-di-GMP-specific phosphodiesterase class I)